MRKYWHLIFKLQHCNMCGERGQNVVEFSARQRDVYCLFLRLVYMKVYVLVTLVTRRSVSSVRSQLWHKALHPTFPLYKCHGLLTPALPVSCPHTEHFA